MIHVGMPIGNEILTKGYSLISFVNRMKIRSVFVKNLYGIQRHEPEPAINPSQEIPGCYPGIILADSRFLHEALVLKTIGNRNEERP